MVTVNVGTIGEIPNIGAVSPIVGNVESLVNAGFSTAQAYANSAFNSSQTYLNALGSAANSVITLPTITDSLGAVEQSIGAFVAPTLPVAPANLTLSLPTLPPDPTLTAVTSLTPQVAPAFTAVIPVIDLAIAVPMPLSASVPTVPTLSTITVPSAPDVPLPDVPSLIGITVPTTPLLNLPIFQAIAPDSPLAPANTFSFTETTYSSTLLTDLRARLLEWVDGAHTGLEPQVENAIWERGRVRELAASMKKMDESRRQFASMGFSKPPGALALQLLEAEQEAQDNIVTQSREVMIKQADLEQSNRRFAFEQAWKTEEGLITYTGQIAQRAFESAKFVQQIFVDIYRENVARYQADIQAYSTKVEVFKAQINAELSKLEIYKAEIEAQKLIGELNVQFIDIYKARVQSALAIIEVFKAQVDAANTLALVNKTQIEGYAAQVNAYGETVRAKASEYDAYATRIRAEVSKADIFKAEADAYGSQVQGFTAAVNAQVVQKNLEIRLGQEVPLELFKARADVFRTEVDAELGRVRTLNETYATGAKVYDSAVQAQTGRMGAESTAFRAETDKLIGEANIRVETAKANLQALIQKVGLLIEAARAGSQVSAQLAASALAGVNLSAGLHASGAASESYGVSNSASNSFSGSANASVSDNDNHGSTVQTIYNL